MVYCNYCIVVLYWMRNKVHIITTLIAIGHCVLHSLGRGEQRPIDRHPGLRQNETDEQPYHLSLSNIETR